MIYTIREQKRNIAFRSMTEMDVSHVMEIENKAYTSPWSSKMYVQALKNPFYHFTVIELDHQIVGYCGCMLLGPKGHILTLAVDPIHQGKGLGDELLRYKLCEIRSLGAKEVDLLVRISNMGAQKLYRKYGFKEVDVRKNVYPDNREDALIMLLSFT